MENLRNEYLEVPMKSIYVVENENGKVKIGVSQDVCGRIQTLSSQGGFMVKNLFYTLPCSNSYEIEHSLHTYFGGKRINGEWFDVDYQLAKDITSIKFEEMSNTIPETKRVITLEEIERKFSYSVPNNNDKLHEKHAPLEEILSFIEEMERIMEKQGSEPWKICEAFKMISEQFGIILPADFVKIPDYKQMQFTDYE